MLLDSFLSQQGCCDTNNILISYVHVQTLGTIRSYLYLINDRNKTYTRLHVSRAKEKTIKIVENKRRLTWYARQRKILVFFTRDPRFQLGDRRQPTPLFTCKQRFFLKKKRNTAIITVLVREATVKKNLKEWVLLSVCVNYRMAGFRVGTTKEKQAIRNTMRHETSS